MTIIYILAMVFVTRSPNGVQNVDIEVLPFETLRKCEQLRNKFLEMPLNKGVDLNIRCLSRRLVK